MTTTDYLASEIERLGDEVSHLRSENERLKAELLTPFEAEVLSGWVLQSIPMNDTAEVADARRTAMYKLRRLSQSDTGAHQEETRK